MYVSNIEVKNYRNYDTATVTLDKGLNIFLGKNAQGKTNLLEALYLLAIGRSPRTTKDKDLIKWDKNQAHIKLTIAKKSGTTKLEMIINEKGKKIILINGIAIKKISQLFGNLNVIHFFPDDLKLIKEAPSDRRRFMDIDICQASQNYFYLLTKYEKILAQRNKLIKTSPSINYVMDTISIWNEQLADTASKIVMSRIKFINKLAPLIKKCHAYLTDNNENIEVEYQGIIGKNVSDIKEKLLNAYTETLQKDFDLGYTQIGPHRDDLKISLNGIDLRSFGSQGQQRTASLALKLGEIEIFAQESNEKPILLLDDVLSELDESRQKKLLNFANKVQTIITCTEFPFEKNNANIIKINNGKII